MWSDRIGRLYACLNCIKYSCLFFFNVDPKQSAIKTAWSGEEKSYNSSSKQKPQKPQKLDVYLISNDFSVGLLNYLRWEKKKIVQKERRVLNCNYNIINPSIISVNIYCECVCSQPSQWYLISACVLAWWAGGGGMWWLGVVGCCLNVRRMWSLGWSGRMKGEGANRENGLKIQHFFRYWRMNSYLIISVQFILTPCRCVR